MRVQVLLWASLAAATAVAQEAPRIVDVTLIDTPYDYRPPQELGVDSPPAVAQGSVFKIWGREMGPLDGVGVEAAELPLSLAGVRVELESPDGVSRDLPLYWVGIAQINAVLPSDAPIGLARLRVAYGEAVSEPFPIKVVKTRPRIFDWRDGDGPGPVAVLPVAQVAGDDGSRRLVTQAEPAQPGDMIVLWATGLGPRGEDSDQSPVPERLNIPLQVYLGDQPVEVDWAGRSGCCAAVDQVQFRIPDDAPVSCFVPLTLRAYEGVVSDLERLPIAVDGEACADFRAPGVSASQGSVRLSRTANDEGVIDSVSAAFGTGEAYPQQDTPAAACFPQTAYGFLFEALESGSPLRLETPSASLSAEKESGAFSRVARTPDEEPFLGPGSYSISLTEGEDVGAFTTTFDVPPPPEAGFDSLPESIGPEDEITVSWSGETAVDFVEISDRVSFRFGDEFSRTDRTGVGGNSTVCVPAPGQSSFTFPTWAVRGLAGAPAAGEFDESRSLRNDVVVTLISRTDESFEAPGLDMGVITYTHNQEIVIPAAGPFSAATPVTTPSGDTVLAELAVTDFERERGLAGRPRLASGRGLLVQFAAGPPAAFPTGELPGPVDVAWLDAMRSVVEVQTIDACESECAPIEGPAAARWALALSAGEADRLGLSGGAVVEW